MTLKSILSILMIISIMFSLNIFTNNDILTENSINVSAEENTINGISESTYKQMVNDTIYLVNEYRATKGLSPLKTSAILGDMANQRAKEQEITGMSHTRPDGSSCFTIYDNYNVSWTALAENSAMGQDTAESVVNCWKNSTYHNENMLGNYQYVSIGITYYNGVYYWVQMFCSTDDEKVINNAYIPDKISNNNPSDTTTSVEDTKMLKKGDINEDGKINIIDVILLKKYILNMISEI